MGVLSVDPLRRRGWGEISELLAANTALASVLSRVPRRFLPSLPPTPLTLESAKSPLAQ